MRASIGNFKNAPTAPLADGVMIAWKKECFRSSATASTFHVSLELISKDTGKGRIAKARGYLANMTETISVLRRRRPRTVICLNQPPFLPMICHFYALLTGGRVIMDFHSGAITKGIWRPFLPYYRHLVRAAPFTICHNRFDGQHVSRWGGRPLHLIALPQVRFGDITYTPRREKPLFFFVCSFAADEPVDLTIEAMRKCPEFDFIVSGNYRKRKLDPAAMPSNVRLAGFMDYSEYLQTMAQATAMLTLSDRPHIMQMAVHEALTIGVPVVTNESPTLREVLGNAGVFTPIAPNSLVEAFHEAVNRHADLAESAGSAKYAIWARTEEELDSLRRNAPANMYMSPEN
ncbi:glycosyltransferase [Pararhizobium sp. BT-229]|uniref:glycosyltransferase n=1 Tax=Pararhizobium sp. BT-229 TaxID=2986923 RepID=UPI0021F7BA5D|nr:glycosyltransferase [Pararhizobium sp. BT-229]MCV9965917.1 glycosyltransferase [Pararhizobium sp. BT-229]